MAKNKAYTQVQAKHLNGLMFKKEIHEKKSKGN
jgi:hypothetical protein